MKRLLIIFFAIALPAMANAQEIRRIESEIALGTAVSGGAGEFSKMCYGELGLAEVRLNLKEKPYDFGVQVGANLLVRENDISKTDVGFTSLDFLAVTDYNSELSDDIRWFAGLGAGLMYCDENSHTELNTNGGYWQTFTSSGGDEFTLCVMPRVGIEVWNHLRITAFYRIQEPANRHLGLSIGLVIGGGMTRL